MKRIGHNLHLTIMDKAIPLPQSIDDVAYEWCLGKPAGCLLMKPPKQGSSRFGSIQYRCNVNNKQRGKMFSMSEKFNEDAARKAAIDYGVKWSFDNGHTRNMVRRVPDGIFWKEDRANAPLTKNNVEVFIDDEHTMLIDFDDLHHVQSNNLTKTKGGHTNSVYYPLFSFKGTREDKKNGKTMQKQVHNFITGWDMVDHINRNPMDNRRCNLRAATHKFNNNNRTCLKEVPGVRQVWDRAGGAWQARIKQDDVEMSKSFGINKYGDEEAYRLAVEARNELCRKFDCNNTGSRADNPAILSHPSVKPT